MSKKYETREQLIADCRYYNGQDKCPFDDSPLNWYWDMERIFVQSKGMAEGENEYFEMFCVKKYPGVPDNLLLIMFTSWGKYTYNIKESMSHFYAIVDDYLDIPSDHYAKDRLPSVGALD